MAARDNSSLLHNVSSGREAVQPKQRQDNSLYAKPIVRSPFSRFSAPHYRFKTFKNKGAVVVLLWSFLGFVLLHFLTENHHKTPLKVTKEKEIDPIVIFTMCLLLYPILGWLADVLFGRYKVIKWSLRVLWFLLILSSLSNALLQYYHHEKPEKLKNALAVIFYISISLGLGGFQANIVQFGIDQITDASSTEITSFLHWCLWVWNFSSVVSGLSQWCVCPKYEVYSYLLLPACLTVAVVLDHLFNHWLVKDPPAPNPFVLICKVLRYAVKNKFPHQRSASTYAGDARPYSRVDLAKHKYGGPFTTEQVEDVKSFFRIVGIIISAAVFTSMFILVYPSYAMVTSRLHGGQYFFIKKHKPCEYSDILTCFQRASVTLSGQILILVGIPLYEFVLYPLLQRYFRVLILSRLNIAFVLLFLSLVSCTILEFVAVYQNSSGSHEVSVECAFNTSIDQDGILPLDYKWMLIPYTLVPIAQFLLLTSATEFLCAQSPYSMKGLLFGFMYGAVGFFLIIGYSISKPFQDHVIVRKMSFGYGCLAWYLVLNLAALLIFLLVVFCAYKCYKIRTRDHNERTFKVNYCTSTE